MARQLKTSEDFKRSLKAKYGLGEGESYKPWLRTQDVKSHGVRAKIQGLKTKRVHHTLSSIETDFFYLAEFSDSVIDIREQFPLFPLNLSIKIAKALNVKHPAHPETGEEIIITTDFLLTREVDGEIIFEAVSVKPEAESDDPRVLEKLEIERVWWELLGVKFSYFVGSDLTQVQSRNISWATHPIREETKRYSQYEIKLALSQIEKGKQLIRDISDNYIKTIGVENEDALNLLRSLIAEKYLTVDLSLPLEGSDFIDVLDKVCVQEVLENGNS